MSPRADGSRPPMRNLLDRRQPRLADPRSLNRRIANRASVKSATGQLGPLNPKEIDMKKLLAYLMLGFFVLGSSAGFAQVPEKCKGLQGDAQKKCIDDAKKG
jgi:hypothetical protein